MTVKAGVKNVVVTLGAHGAALFQSLAAPGRCQVHLMPAITASVVNTNGAGDCLVAGACMRLMQGGTPLAALAYGIVSPLL